MPLKPFLFNRFELSHGHIRHIQKHIRTEMTKTILCFAASPARRIIMTPFVDGSSQTMRHSSAATSYQQQRHQHQQQNLIGYGLSRRSSRCKHRTTGTRPRSRPSTLVLSRRLQQQRRLPKTPATSALICHRCQQTAAAPVARHRSCGGAGGPPSIV